MMFYATRNYGLRNKCCRRIGLNRNALNVTGKKDCYEKVKAAVREHQRLSGAKTVGNCGDEYVKYR